MLDICGRLLSLIYIYAVIKEWDIGEEFQKTKKIIVVGSLMQAFLVRVSLIKTRASVSYCNLNEFDEIYEYRKNVKWIIFDKKKAKYMKNVETDILIFPIL